MIERRLSLSTQHTALYLRLRFPVRGIGFFEVRQHLDALHPCATLALPSSLLDDVPDDRRTLGTIGRMVRREVALKMLRSILGRESCESLADFTDRVAV